MKTKRNQRVMLKRKTAESRRSYGRGRLVASALIDFAPRLLRIAAVAATAAGAAYLLRKPLTDWLFAYVGDQPFMYTSASQVGLLVTMFVCAGLLASIPVAAFHILRAMESRFVRVSAAYFTGLAFLSAVLAATGVYFGYHYGLQYALLFLSQQFLPDPAQPMAAVFGYANFASVFLLTSALVFQIPLVMYIANQLTIRHPKAMLAAIRPVVLAGLVVGAAVSPADDVLIMVFLAVPIVAMYVLGIGAVWAANHTGRIGKAVAESLRNNDIAAQEERLRQLDAALTIPVLEPIPISSPESESPSFVTPPAPVDDYLQELAPTRPQSASVVESKVAHPAKHAEPKVSANEPSRRFSEPAEPVRQAPATGRQETAATVNGIRRRIY